MYLRIVENCYITMQKIIPRLCLIIIWLCFSFFNDASAQHSKQKKRQYKSRSNRTSQFTGKKLVFANEKHYLTLGVSVNALNYFGDIAPKSYMGSTDISFTRPGLGVSSSARIGSSLAVRAEFLYGQLSSSDYKAADPNDEIAIYRYARNLHFRNNIKDFSVVGTYDFFANPGAVMYRIGFTPYIFGGVSVFHHNPKALVPEEAVLYPNSTLTLPEAGKWVALRPLHTEGKENAYSAFQISFPAGFGARYRVNQVMDIEAEMSYRYLLTDYIDDISQNYVDKGTLESELAKVMSDRSLETTDALTGEIRYQNMKNTEFNRNVVTYLGADGQQYVAMAGYGRANDIRGSAKDKDIFLTTSFRVVFMVGKSPLSSRNFRRR